MTTNSGDVGFFLFLALLGFGGGSSPTVPYLSAKESTVACNLLRPGINPVVKGEVFMLAGAAGTRATLLAVGASFLGTLFVRMVSQNGEIDSVISFLKKWYQCPPRYESFLMNFFYSLCDHLHVIVSVFTHSFDA